MPERPPAAVLVTTALFIAFVCTIVVMANTRTLAPFVGWVHEIPAGDKIAHALGYGTAALLLNMCLGARRWRRVPLGSVIVLGAASLEELSQLGFAWRSASWFDALANTIGIVVLGALGMKLATRSRPRRHLRHGDERPPCPSSSPSCIRSS